MISFAAFCLFFRQSFVTKNGRGLLMAGEMAGRTPTEPERVFVACQLWLPRTTLVFSSHLLGVSVFSSFPQLPPVQPNPL
jgi:hypothetical protein